MGCPGETARWDVLGDRGRGEVGGVLWFGSTSNVAIGRCEYGCIACRRRGKSVSERSLEFRSQGDSQPWEHRRPAGRSSRSSSVRRPPLHPISYSNP